MWKSVKRLFWESGDREAPSSREQIAPISERAGALGLLRDVPGLIGSLAVDPTGNLLACDMPQLFDEEAIRQVATRVIQLFAALGSDGDNFDRATVAYQGYQLHVERLNAALLGVLSHDTLDRVSLKLAIRTLSKRLELTSEPSSA